MKKVNHILLLLAIMFFPVFHAHAFSLHYSLPEQISQGKNFEVEISLNRDSSFLKAIEGLINFNSDSFELINIIKNNSTFEKWIVAPYLKENGQIFFSGIFNSDLNINNLFNIVFKKLDNNDLELNVGSGAILGEDDKLYDLEEIIPTEERASIFNVTSLTHENPGSWYSNKTVKLEWNVPCDAKKIKILIDEKEESYPTVEYDELIREKEIELDDGIWYFHIRYFGDNGWSPIEHRKIMIDTENPKFLNVKIGKDMIEFLGEDELSGIDLYEIDIPFLNQKYFTNEHNFKINTINKSGSYDVKIRAYDKAQNYLEEEEIITIKETTSPHFSGVVLGRDGIFILGYVDDPNSKVYASIDGNDLIFQDVAGVSSDGKFVHLIEKNLTPGLYNLHLMTIADNGVSTKNKKAILVIDKKISFSAVPQILVACGLTIIFLVVVYTFSKKNIKNKNKK